MDANSLLEKMDEMKKSFLDEGILDHQFVVLQELEGPENPNFLKEVMDSYFEESQEIIEWVEDQLEGLRPNFYKMERILHQLKGKCVSVGAQQVKKAVNEMRMCLPEGDLMICSAAIASIKELQEDLQMKLENYFELKEQVRELNTAEEPQSDVESEEERKD